MDLVLLKSEIDGLRILFPLLLKMWQFWFFVSTMDKGRGLYKLKELFSDLNDLNLRREFWSAQKGTQAFKADELKGNFG